MTTEINAKLGKIYFCRVRDIDMEYKSRLEKARKFYREFVANVHVFEE